MKYKVGDKVEVKSEFDFCEEYRGKQFVIEERDSSDNTYLCHPTTGGYRIWFSEEKLKPVAIRSVLFPNVEYVFNEKQAEEYAERLNKELAKHFNAFSNDGISAKKWR